MHGLFSEDAAKALRRRYHIAQRLNVAKRTPRLKTLQAHHLAGAHKLGLTYL